jgi:predicted acetyltransferase
MRCLLVNSTEAVPGELGAVLRELGPGDSRFGGTSFGRGQCTFEQFLQECRDAEDAEKVPAGLVPQSTYWLVDDSNRAVGIVRVRHRLNERLTQFGGHIGYYVRPSERGKGYGKEALRLALEQLRRRGAPRALLTVNPENTPSARVVLANGGVPDAQGTDPVTGEVVDRYWIEL